MICVSPLILGKHSMMFQLYQRVRIQLVFISPEALVGNRRWRDMLRSKAYQDNLVAFVIDEAHCVKKWQVTSLVFLFIYLYSSFFN